MTCRLGPLELITNCSDFRLLPFLPSLQFMPSRTRIRFRLTFVRNYFVFVRPCCNTRNDDNGATSPSSVKSGITVPFPLLRIATESLDVNQRNRRWNSDPAAAKIFFAASDINM